MHKNGDLLLAAGGPPTNTYIFYCPACKENHSFQVIGNVVWELNENMEKPTFKPSLLYLPPHARCHLYVTDGQIQFLSDCEHELAGKTVPMVGWSEEKGWWDI